MLNKQSVIAVVAVVGIAIAGLVVFKGQRAAGLEFQKGMGYVTWSQNAYGTAASDKSLEMMAETGTKWVAVLVSWYQTNCWSGDIKRMEITPSDESIVHVIQKAHELGMKVMLKPHLDLLDKSDGSWRGEIGCVSEPDWDRWFDEYTDYIMHYAKIASEENVEMICIGTELSTSSSTKGYKWSEMIKTIRGQYSGLLTYAAHWDRYQDIRFWKELDYVGINAYFPLTENLQPTVAELEQGWVKWVEEMEMFQAKVKVPIIFPEIGCNSCDGAAIRPWEHSPRTEINLQLQADYYDVLLKIFSEKKWFYGLYWWYWGTNEKMGGEQNRGFTPQNKPSEKIVKTWYAKHITRPSSL
jgi:glycosyl hydrolase family 113